MNLEQLLRMKGHPCPACQGGAQSYGCKGECYGSIVTIGYAPTGNTKGGLMRFYFKSFITPRGQQTNPLVKISSLTGGDWTEGKRANVIIAGFGESVQGPYPVSPFVAPYERVGHHRLQSGRIENIWLEDNIVTISPCLPQEPIRGAPVDGRFEIEITGKTGEPNLVPELRLW